MFFNEMYFLGCPLYTNAGLFSYLRTKAFCLRRFSALHFYVLLHLLIKHTIPNNKQIFLEIILVPQPHCLATPRGS